MKKIFRMALVFALAGATLMYTSCTKDYQEEINNLDNKVSSLQTDLSGKLSDLEGQVSTLKSGLSSLESAYKAADESIKSDLSGLKSKVSNIEEAIKALATKDELKSTKEALEKKIADDIKAAKDELLAKAEDLQSQINTLDAALKLKADADKVYTKDEVDAFLAKYFTKEEINEFLAKKADKDAVYTKDEITAFLAEKADKNSVFTKEEVMDLLAKYFTKEEVEELLAKKADADKVYTKDEINDLLKAYYTSAQIDEMFKNYYTKEEADKILSGYYTKEEIDKAFGNYFTKEEIEKMFSGYYTKEEIEKKLADYYTKAEIDKTLQNYFTKAEVEKLLEGYYTKDEADKLLAKKADADKVYTKDEINKMLEDYYTKAEIDKMFEDYYTKTDVDNLLKGYYTKDEIDAFLAKYYTKEEIDAKIDELKKAQEELNKLFALLSDELRSIVFLPDLYFAGIEATTYDFGSFMGFYVETIEEEDDVYYGETDGVKYVFPVGAKVDADILYAMDEDGNALYFKTDPMTGDWLYDADGNLIPAKPNDNGAEVYYPGSFVLGQIGKARYNLNPSSFPVDKAQWSLKGRNVKYVLKSDETSYWTPIFEGISKDEDGLATVLYRIENPEYLFTCICGAIRDYMFSAILRDGHIGNWYEHMMSAMLQAEIYDYNNIATMQLVGALDETRSIYSDWHAISSFEEFVSHLAFRNDNSYVAWRDCGLGIAEAKKDLFANAYDAVDADPSVPVKYNGGPIDLEKLIAIHTFDIQTYASYGNYTLAEFTEKYPGFHFEFELVPYTIGDYLTGEEYYGQIEGSMFTPCYVESDGTTPTSVPIAKDSESAKGISAVGRMPMVLVTLVNDETEIVQTLGWFRILIAKDPKAPRVFNLPDRPVVPFICGNFRLATNWHEFSFFVLEKMGVEYKQFINTYTYDGVWAYAIVNKNGIPTRSFQKVASSGFPGQIIVPNYPKADRRWGFASYNKDYTGSGINDVFQWDVDPSGVGEGQSATIYFRFHNGEDIVYFGMTANVAKRASMYFAKNKMNNEWYADIDAEPLNTVRLNAPVPVANLTSPVKGGDVLKFQRDINHWFVGYKPILGLNDESLEVYANFFNATEAGDPDEGEMGLLYDDRELVTKTEFFFDKTQPVIKNGAVEYPLYTNWFGSVYYVLTEDEDGNVDYTELETPYEASKLLYTATYGADGQIVMDGYYDENDDYVEYPAIFADALVAWIMPRVDDAELVDEYDNPLPNDTLKYLCTEKSKELLNLWSYKETSQDKMLYANILAKNSYGFCEIPVEDGNFHVRFIRPLDVNFTAQDVSDESAVDGFNVQLAKFISGIVDWNNQKVIVPDKKPNDKYFVPNVIKEVDMYAYYGFKTLRIDLLAAERDNWNTENPAEFGALKTVAPKAELALGTTKDNTAEGVFSPLEGAANPYELDITDIGADSQFRKLWINYRNDKAFVETFTLRIPVEVDYAWGTLTAWMVVKVKDTGSTTGH